MAKKASLLECFVFILLFMRRQNTQSPPKIDCFEYIKQSLLKSNHQKYTCQIFIRKKIPESKISKPKYPLIIPAASLATPEHLHPLGACILRYQEMAKGQYN